MQNNELLLTDGDESKTKQMHLRGKLMLRYGITSSVEHKGTRQTTSTSLVYFENVFRWSFFHHNLKMRGPSCKIMLTEFLFLKCRPSEGCDTTWLSVRTTHRL
jgi:hypothetical protein